MSHTPEAGAPPWILAVDDDPRVLEAIQLVLETLGGLRVCTATDVASVEDCLTRIRPAVVVLDLGLPGVDVTGLAARMRGETERPAPLLVISADERGAARAAELGAYAFLAKPFGPEELLACVGQGLGPGGGRP
ncbi:response regulator transcription factor [Pyxidicoccus xibeiensis]|uniref:response regulator transcription factor n=1 Tax=Pyxidicoccus xibeiensis TaxID=2906759 RepID=UPI0020A733A9|nr:response regulator [Pyxidicoccus xibeiensis]MCP3143943.1 response regulator [Pyxidicoccus xibeiensis]